MYIIYIYIHISELQLQVSAAYHWFYWRIDLKKSNRSSFNIQRRQIKNDEELYISRACQIWHLVSLDQTFFELRRSLSNFAFVWWNGQFKDGFKQRFEFPSCVDDAKQKGQDPIRELHTCCQSIIVPQLWRYHTPNETWNPGSWQISSSVIIYNIMKKTLQHIVLDTMFYLSVCVWLKKK